MGCRLSCSVLWAESFSLEVSVDEHAGVGERIAFNLDLFPVGTIDKIITGEGDQRGIAARRPTQRQLRTIHGQSQFRVWLVEVWAKLKRARASFQFRRIRRWFSQMERFVRQTKR